MYWNVGAQHACTEKAPATHLVDELGLARPTKDGENLEKNVDDGRLAKEGREAGDEVVEVPNRDAPDFGVVMAALEENIANFAVDRLVDRVQIGRAHV